MRFWPVTGFRWWTNEAIRLLSGRWPAARHRKACSTPHRPVAADAVPAAAPAKTSWQPLRDIQPVLMISGVTFGILVPADSPLLDWGRAHPGQLTVGSTGVGTTAHPGMADILSRSGICYVHVPYRGTADQMLAVANHALMVDVDSTGFAPFVDCGQMRLLAVCSATRSRRWPEVPAVEERGFPGAVYNAPYGIGLPYGAGPHIVKRRHDAFHHALFQPRHVAELAQYDPEPSYLNTQQPHKPTWSVPGPRNAHSSNAWASESRRRRCRDYCYPP